MARSDHLPIYKAAYGLCLWLEQVVHGFSRYHKFAIGSDDSFLLAPPRGFSHHAALLNRSWR